MDPFDFSGKTVLVVGGSSGIGNGIAQAFRRQGASVHAWGTKPSAGDYSRTEGSDLDGLSYSQVDVSDVHALEAREIALTRLDVLVLAQGSVIYNRGEFAMGGFRRVLDTNLTSVMACCVKFRPLLAANRGALISIGSTAAYRATLGNPAYNASKAGLAGLTRTLAAAWAQQGVRVNSIAPGFVATKLTEVTTRNPRRLAAALHGIPLGRLGTPQDIAGAALFLACPLADYVIGQTLVVDGGMTCA